MPGYGDHSLSSELARHAFLHERASIYVTDEQFLLDLPSDRQNGLGPILCLLRRFMARVCRVAPEKIAGEERRTKLVELLRSDYQGTPDWRAVGLQLEEHLRSMIRGLFGNRVATRLCSNYEIIERCFPVTSFAGASDTVADALLGAAPLLRGEADARTRDAEGHGEAPPTGIQWTNHLAQFLTWNAARSRSDLRDKFIESRWSVYVTDVAFVRSLWSEPDERLKRIAVVLRRLLADECEVAPERINCTETMSTLAEFAGSPGERGLNLAEQLSALTGQWPEIDIGESTLLAELWQTKRLRRCSDFGEWVSQASLELGDILRDIGYRVV